MLGAFNTNTSGGSFGGFGGTNQAQPQQQPQQQATGSLFGGFGTAPNATTQTNPTGGGGSLFGAPAQNNAGGNTGGGLFGNTAGQNSLFGTANAGQQQQQQQTQQPAGGLFGNTQQSQPATGGGLFGGATQQNNASGGLFGNSNVQTQNTPGGGLFGGSTTGTSLFGAPANTTTTTTSNLFGGNSTTPAAGNMFASTNTAPSGGLFGTQNQTTQSSLFAQQKPAGSSFGQVNQQPQPTSSLFGSTTQQQQQPSLFSSINPVQSTTGLFGTLGQSALAGSTLGNSLFATRATVMPTQHQTDPQSQFMSLLQRIEGIKQAWDPASPQCRFQHFFYNLVEPSHVSQYGRPQNATNDALWEKAVRENPDPSCLVPVLAVGLDDLQQRVDAQTKQGAEHSERTKDLKARIEALVQRHEVTNTARLRRAAALQMQLTHRVLKVVQHLHLLIPALRSSSIRPEEEALRAALEDIDEEIRRPGGISRMRGKLNEMWALVDAVRAARERNRTEGQVEWAVVDEEGLGHIAQILTEEQAGLAHVTKILQRALKDLAVIQGVPPKDEDPDSLAGSATALRDSLIR